MEGPRQIEVKPFLIVWCICLVAMGSLGVRIGRSQRALDFQEFYAAGYEVRTAPWKLYDPEQQDQIQRALTSRTRSLTFYHPSYETVLFVPFSYLKYSTAYVAYMVFSLLLLMAAFFAARPAFSSVIPFLQPRPGLAFFTFVPMLVTLLLGQDSILSLLLFCLAWREMESGNDFRAGCWVALDLFKFQFAIPIAILIAIRRGRRFAGGFLITAFGIGLLCWAIGGAVGMASYIRLVSGAASALDKGAIAQAKLTLSPVSMPNLTGLLYTCGAQFLHPLFLFEAVIGTCTLALFVWCARAVRQADEDAAFSIAILGGLLLSYHLYDYELTLLLLPIALMANRIDRYILASLFILPFVLMFVGAGWIFLIAVPMLGMLIDMILFSKNQIGTRSDLVRA